MKNLITTLFLLSMLTFSLSLTAQQALSEAQAYLHLAEVNQQWMHYASESPQTSVQFENDNDRISYHLNLVIKHLQNNLPEHLSKKQLAKRQSLLSELKVYADAKTFPVNSNHAKRQPYFIDDVGTHCAVGYLMAASGNSSLANEIRKKYNYHYIHEMPENEVAPWAKTYGFTIDELAWIQPGYPPQDPYTSFVDGPNGTVKEMAYDAFNSRMIVTGAFTEIGGNACSQIGYFKNGSFSCLDGLNGQVKSILPTYTKLYVAGNFQHNGVTYPLASFENGTWSYVAVPLRPSAQSSLVFNPGESSMNLGITIENNLISQTEVWYLANTGDWIKKLTVNGTINAQTASQEGSLYGGQFDVATVHTTGQSDVTIACNNLILKDPWSNNWQALGQEVSNTVLSMKVVGSSVYIGGNCVTGQEVCFTRLLNGVLQPLIIYEDYFYNNEPCAIRSIDLFDGNLVLGGDFILAPFVGVYGDHLAEYDISYNNLTAIADLDQPVNSVATMGGELYMGGAFTTYGYNGYSLPYFAKQGVSTSIKQPKSAVTLEVYPNPVVTSVNVTGITGAFSYTVYDVTGRLLQQGLKENDSEIDLSNLDDGIFILSVKTTSGAYSTKLVKGA